MPTGNLTTGDVTALDVFAAHALQALLANPEYAIMRLRPNPPKLEALRPVDFAKISFQLARAMMDERAKDNPGS